MNDVYCEKLTMTIVLGASFGDHGVLGKNRISALKTLRRTFEQECCFRESSLMMVIIILTKSGTG